MSEDIIREHLQDVESSFLPTLSPIQTGKTNPHGGIDDSYLFDSPQKVDNKSSADHDTSLASQTTSNLENLDSSPTAAAAARTISRAVSMASTAARNTPLHGDSGADTQAESFISNAESFDPRFDLSHAPSDRLDAGSTPGFGLRGKRPKYLRSRFASQRSSTSSFITNPDSQDGSDATGSFEVDFGLPPSGAPALGGRNSSNPMPRTISIGSMASAVGHEGYDNNTQQLETLQEAESPNQGRYNEDLLKTPKPSRENLASAPTDTVIAQHVKNVHVPDSLAREYKVKNGLETPFRPSATMSSIGTTSKSGKNLTLKEQSSTIERLSKENFDLKLKVMFLSDRLDKLSEEGIKEMISENVDLKTNLAVLQRDNKMLRKRVKELEKKAVEDSTRPNTSSGTSSAEQTVRMSEEEAYEREQELIFLRERVEEYAIEIEKLRGESLHRESEKRKLADIVKTMGEKTGENIGRQEEADVWKDLLEQETAHREQTDEDNQMLRDEVFQLKKELAGLQTTPHTTNIYHINRKQKERGIGGLGSRPPSSYSGEAEGSQTNYSAATTLVDELRRESEQLRHENAELRREVGAQTSMLTSRNREKERLYQEIEDLKLGQRRGGIAHSSTADSILERSASRAGIRGRSQSRDSRRARQTSAEDEAEREELENRFAEMRDNMNEVKFQNQELQRELESCMEDFEKAVNGKRQAEDAAIALQEDMENALNDLMSLQAERDEALGEQGQMENEFESLRREAQEEIDTLETEADHRNEELQRLQGDLTDRAESFGALQEEMRKMSESLVGLEDEQNNKLRKIRDLQMELDASNRELEELEVKLGAANDKNKRLYVQSESSQGEIAFLREEQEGDKIRIGELEAVIANAEQSVREEKERAKELEERLQQERAQRDLLASREKEDVQQMVNGLNREVSTARDESKRLYRDVKSREIEATEWKERLMELESNLRETLGDLNGTRSSLLKSIANMQRELEETVRQLDQTRASLAEKERIVKQRDALLESQAMDVKSINEQLDRERGMHRMTKTQFETFQKTHQHLSKTANNQDSRIAELETTRGQERRKLISLEQTARDQLTERNELLLILWRRLSTLCGREWANGHALVDKQVLPSLEVIANRLPGFSKNLLAAVKTIEVMLGSFEAKIKGVEKDLTREYQALEANLDMRVKKLTHLEAKVRNSAVPPTGGIDNRRVQQLEEDYRRLKVENATLRTTNDVRIRASQGNHGGSPSPSVHRGPGDRGSIAESGSTSLARSGGSELGKSDKVLLLRLKGLEQKVKQEREGRNLDREQARAMFAKMKDEMKRDKTKVRNWFEQSGTDVPEYLQ